MWQGGYIIAWICVNCQSGDVISPRCGRQGGGAATPEAVALDSRVKACLRLAPSDAGTRDRRLVSLLSNTAASEGAAAGSAQWQQREMYAVLLGSSLTTPYTGGAMLTIGELLIVLED